MDEERILALERRMAEAVAKDDFEAAARLRDELAALRAGPSRLRRQIPGAMGLGTDQQVFRPPEGWAPPTRPDPMTSGHKRGGRRR